MTWKMVQDMTISASYFSFWRLLWNRQNSQKTSTLYINLVIEPCRLKTTHTVRYIYRMLSKKPITNIEKFHKKDASVAKQRWVIEFLGSHMEYLVNQRDEQLFNDVSTILHVCLIYLYNLDWRQVIFIVYLKSIRGS